MSWMIWPDVSCEWLLGLLTYCVGEHMNKYKSRYKCKYKYRYKYKYEHRNTKTSGNTLSYHWSDRPVTT